MTSDTHGENRRMDLLPRTEPKVFNLLSIGQRGAGKTVFLAGSYAELHSQHQKDEPQSWWFDCRDAHSQTNIDNILSYVTRTAQYPPPTMKITNFNFSLKHQSNLGKTQTLSHFCWWDIPGESCNFHNPNFRSMVFNSHGCCVLIDAYALAHKPADSQTFDDIIQSAMSVAELVYRNGLWYPFAVILTKCDQIESEPCGREHLKEGLQRLTTFLSRRVEYKLFYSKVPIVSAEGISTFKSRGAAASLLWLVHELEEANHRSLMNELLTLVTSPLPNHLRAQPARVEGTLQSRLKPGGRGVGVQNTRTLRSVTHRNISILALVMVGLLGVVGIFLVKNAVVDSNRQSETGYLNRAQQ